MKKLPEEFLYRIKAQLADEDEYEAFLSSYDKSPERGLRFNMKKFHELHDSPYMVTYEKLVSDWHLIPVPGSDYKKAGEDSRSSSFYIDEAWLTEIGIKPGRHPYHDSGLYYMQEPAAMEAVMHLDIRPFDRVLDACASPGGKSTQAADCLDENQGGLLISNEYVGNRARILSSNIERLGIRNAAVLNEDTSRLADHFNEYFSRIIVDAPCSGEGMFRKDDTAIDEWSPENVDMCVKRQKEIMDNAVRMLAPGGKLSYSTCTFERAEDEELVEWVLGKYPDLSLTYQKKNWPHRDRGEGHFVAILEKAGNDARATEHEHGVTYLIEEKGDVKYLIPDFMPDLSGLRVLRKGIQMESVVKSRIEPEHALSHALDLSEDGLKRGMSYKKIIDNGRKKPGTETIETCEVLPIVDLPVEDMRVKQYLMGMEINLTDQDEAIDLQNGYVIVACSGAALGVGKKVGNRIKNHYPKGLRYTSI